MPDDEAWTDELVWTDDNGTPLPVAQVPPVAYSEGVRLAAHVYAGRQVAEEGQ